MRDRNGGAAQRGMALGLAALLLASLGAGRPASAESDEPAARAETDRSFHHSLWPPHLARGRIGVQVQPMTPELREHMKAPADRGILVTRVVPDRPGAAADLRVGDVIVEADNAPMEGPFDLVRAVAGVAEGDEIELKIVRDGEEQRLTVAPEGEPRPWMDPHRWGVQHGRQELRQRLHEFERRLEELERRLDREPADDGAQQT
ncbi:MAG: PDZ domain-containing protein [Deltaproteobacteria bacterium]|nr:PDZ domain-containing protein [Deltaproteobacteria bacterium]